MKSAAWARLCHIKGTDSYLTRDGQIVARASAMISKEVICAFVAWQKFGEKWDNYVEIIPCPEREYYLRLARSGAAAAARNRNLRRKLREHGQDTSVIKPNKPWHPKRQTDNLPARKRRQGKSWWNNGMIAIHTRGLVNANLLAKRVGIRRGEVNRSWSPCKPLDLNSDIKTDGVFQFFPDTGWQQIL